MDQPDAFDRFQIRAAGARGGIISICAAMESIMDGILSKYFCRDEEHQRELVELIFASERMNLRGKYHLLIELLRRKCVKDEFAKKFSGLQKRFDDFAAIRNKFAHEPIIIPVFEDEFYDKYAICLMTVKDVSKSKCYTENDIKEIIDLMEALRKELAEDISAKILGNG